MVLQNNIYCTCRLLPQKKSNQKKSQCAQTTCDVDSDKNKTAFRALTPSRGHYKALEQISPLQQAENIALDKIIFPWPEAKATRAVEFKPLYLSALTLKDFEVPDFPANSSKQTRAELDYLLQLQAQRNDAEVAYSIYLADIYYSARAKPEDANYQALRKNLFHIGRSIGTWFNPETLPITADFMAKVWQDASFFMWSAKNKFLRARPYQLDAQLKNLEETNWPAYPSGHALNSYVNAYVYQELAPEFTDVFIKDAYDMAHSREIIGVHFPSDSEISRQLARRVVNKLFENESFKKDFEAVKNEWEMVRQ